MNIILYKAVIQAKIVKSPGFVISTFSLPIFFLFICNPHMLLADKVNKYFEIFSTKLLRCSPKDVTQSNSTFFFFVKLTKKPNENKIVGLFP